MVPAPHLIGPFVGGVEIVFGTLIILGFLTRIASIPLLIDISVAILSTKIPILWGHSHGIPKLAHYNLWGMLHEARTDFSMRLGLLFLLIVGAGHGLSTRSISNVAEANRKAMNNFIKSRRRFLKAAAISTGAVLIPRSDGFAQPQQPTAVSSSASESTPADYTVRIKVSPIEIAPNRIISTTNYNGQFPGPLIRLKEGQPVTIDIFNDTDVPEQLHWHGQMVRVDVDGSAEEGTPYIPAHGKRRITFTPRPAGFRFSHTHNRAGANLAAGQYNGEVGPVYIEPKNEPGNYDHEVFLVLKEFEPTFSRGGDMAQNFLPPVTVKALEEQGESVMKASLAKGMPHGYEVGYGSFTINGCMLGHSDPIRVKQGERVLFHVLSGSATEIRSLSLPWTINGVAYPMTGESSRASFHLRDGKRYRIRMKNASDDIHPIHLHRHSFELTKIFGESTSRIFKDVVTLGGYQEAEIDFVADNPGLTLFHCHQQLHLDFGFMALFDYV